MNLFDDEKEEIECRHCGETDLYWQEDEDGWHLRNEAGTRHVCEPDAEGF